jgi:hypothetical protein
MLAAAAVLLLLLVLLCTISDTYRRGYFLGLRRRRAATHL